MRWSKTQLFLAVAVVLGTLAAGVGYLTLSSMATQAAARSGTSLTPVVVAATDVTFGTRLDPNMLRVVRYPKESVPDGAYASVDSVAGQVTKVFLSGREPVTSAKLSARGGGLSMLIRPNLRATSIEVDAVSGVSGFVLPGDRVDVLMTVSRPGPTLDAVTRTLLQNVEVLAAGQKTEQNSKKPVSVQAVTVLVDPRGAEAIALARHEGELHLVLRNPEDTGMGTVEPMSMQEILGGGTKAPSHAGKGARMAERPAAPPSPAARSAEKPMVRVIREAKISEVTAPRDSE